MRSDLTPRSSTSPAVAAPDRDRLSATHRAKRSRRSRPKATSDIIENTSEAQFLLRFIVPAREVDALAAAIRTEGSRAQRCLSTGFDTADGRLAARGVFVSTCKRGNEWVQVAVATTSDCSRLLVHEVDLGARRGGASPELLPHLHAGADAGVAMRTALGDADDESPLLASFSIDATRLKREVKTDGAIVEIAQVTGMITTAEASMPFQEFEVRLVSGPVAALFRVGTEWSTRHGLSLSTASNGERGARLAAGHPEGFPATANLPHAPFVSGADFLRATFDSCLSQILANASVVGDGTQDRHVIAQLRQGLERVRTAIAELSPMATDMDEAWDPVLQRTFHELASHHCATALRAPLIHEMRSAGLAYALACSHPRESRPPAAIVQDAELQRTLLEMLAYRHALAAQFRPKRGTLKQMQRHFADELVGCHASVAADAMGLRSSSKRRRASRHLDHLYRLATFAGPLYGTRRVDSFLMRCRAAQEAFATDGEHRSGLDALEDDDDRGVDVKFARRWLAARLVQDRKACETLLRRVGKAAAFWAA